MQLTFTIDQLAFWSSNPAFNESDFPFLFEGEPDVGFISPMARRRLPKVAKIMAWLDHELDAGQLPAVYATKYAEISNTIQLVRQFDHDLSPAKFSMSVNNAIPGLLSVVTKNEAPYSVIDSMEGLLESALVEACGSLQDHPKVKVVLFEEDTAEPFSELGVKEHLTVLELVISRGNSVSLNAMTSTEVMDNLGKTSEIQSGLLKFLAEQEPEYIRNTARKRWHWQRR